MRKILIVDDDEKIRNIYRDLLIDEGYEVIEAPSAHYANERLLKENIDLVILDIKMPGTDGSIMYEVIKIFHRNCKVIISSVYPLDEQRHLIPGAEDYHDKSQGMDLLLSKIEKILESTSSQNK